MSVLEWDGTTVTEEEWSNLELKTPIFQFKLHGGQPIEIHRCDTDGGIVTDKQESLARHAGHKVRQPVLLKRAEVLALVEGKL